MARRERVAKALWRRVETMTPYERFVFLGMGGGAWVIQKVDIPGLTPETFVVPQDSLGYTRWVLSMDGAALWTSTCSLTPMYRKARASFLQSREWREFSRAFRDKYPDCVKCGEPGHSTHHKSGCEASTLVIALGFGWVLDHPECCEVQCQDCHYQEHKGLIEREKAGRRAMLAAF